MRIFRQFCTFALFWDLTWNCWVLTSKRSKVFWHKCRGTLSDTSTEILWYLKSSSIFNMEAFVRENKITRNTPVPIFTFCLIWRGVSTCLIESRRSTESTFELERTAGVETASDGQVSSVGSQLNKTPATLSNTQRGRKLQQDGHNKKKSARFSRDFFLTPFKIAEDNFSNSFNLGRHQCV